MRASWCLPICATALLIAEAASADTPPPPANRADVERRTAAMFDLVDRNHDGVMTRGEYLAATIAIARARGGTPTARGIALVGAQFDAVDTRHTGRITRADFIGEKMGRFDAMDLNHDGVVSAGESHKAAKLLAAEMKARKKAAKAP